MDPEKPAAARHAPFPPSRPAEPEGPEPGTPSAGPLPRPGAEPRTTVVTGFLASRGAGEIAHPGGTLLAHLQRVEALLDTWGARPELRLAGLCHAFYGTDGFAVALGDVGHRGDLRAVIGEEAEELVLFYASCDRAYSYDRLTAEPPSFRDRFTGAVLHPPQDRLRDFAELTAANELDVMRAGDDLRARHGRTLHDLLMSWRDLLTPTAVESVRTLLP